MSKSTDRATSRYARDALTLLGNRIRIARLELRLTMDGAATRSGTSRAVWRRIENGDPGTAIGTTFEAAAVVGVPLFDISRDRLAGHLAHASEKLLLLPAAARNPASAIVDDF